MESEFIFAAAADAAFTKKSGIYLIQNLVNHKTYVGSAVNLLGRKCTHLHDLRGNKHANLHLQRTYNKYGESSFRFVILECCEKDELISREQHWIDTLSPSFNLQRIAGSNLGYKASDETKAKMSKVRKGRVLTEEHKKKISESHVGKKHNKETKQRLSEIGMGTKNGSGKRGEKAINNLLEAWTDERKQRMREKFKGRIISEEQRKKLSDSLNAYYAGRKAECPK